jgi:thiol-disulfide isomerase/thioredoxin
MKLKLKKIIFPSLLSALTIMLTACTNNNNATTETGGGFPSSDMSGYGIEGEHRFYDVTMFEALELLEDETFNGILYFGFPGCPWCQAAVPVMHEASQQTNTDIFYVSRSRDIREDEGWEEADATMAWWLNEQIELDWIYEELDEDADEDQEPTPIRPNIFVPQIIHLRNGVVVDEHEGTVDGHVRLGDGTLPELTEEQRTTLLETYIRIFSAVNEVEVCPIETIDEDSCS